MFHNGFKKNYRFTSWSRSLLICDHECDPALLIANVVIIVIVTNASFKEQIQKRKMAKFELSQETRKNLLVLPQVRNKDGNLISHEESNPDPRTGNSIVSWAIACFIYDTHPIPTARITKMLNFKVVNFHYRYYLNYSNMLIHESLLYTSSGIF